jgi:hypothetical protein
MRPRRDICARASTTMPANTVIERHELRQGLARQPGEFRLVDREQVP